MVRKVLRQPRSFAQLFSEDLFSGVGQQARNLAGGLTDYYGRQQQEAQALQEQQASDQQLMADLEFLSQGGISEDELQSYIILAPERRKKLFDNYVQKISERGIFRGGVPALQRDRTGAADLVGLLGPQQNRFGNLITQARGQQAPIQETVSDKFTEMAGPQGEEELLQSAVDLSQAPANTEYAPQIQQLLNNPNVPTQTKNEIKKRIAQGTPQERQQLAPGLEQGGYLSGILGNVLSGALTGPGSFLHMLTTPTRDTSQELQTPFDIQTARMAQVEAPPQEAVTPQLQSVDDYDEAIKRAQDQRDKATHPAAIKHYDDTLKDLQDRRDRVQKRGHAGKLPSDGEIQEWLSRGIGESAYPRNFFESFINRGSQVATNAFLASLPGAIAGSTTAPLTNVLKEIPTIFGAELSGQSARSMAKAAGAGETAQDVADFIGTFGGYGLIKASKAKPLTSLKKQSNKRYDAFEKFMEKEGTRPSAEMASQSESAIEKTRNQIKDKLTSGSEQEKWATRYVNDLERRLKSGPVKPTRPVSPKKAASYKAIIEAADKGQRVDKTLLEKAQRALETPKAGISRASRSVSPNALWEWDDAFRASRSEAPTKISDSTKRLVDNLQRDMREIYMPFAQEKSPTITKQLVEAREALRLLHEGTTVQKGMDSLKKIPTPLFGKVGLISRAIKTIAGPFAVPLNWLEVAFRDPSARDLFGKMVYDAALKKPSLKSSAVRFMTEMNKNHPDLVKELAQSKKK